MVHYIFQIILFQLAFLLVYELWLKKETFFSYNRVYLLVTPVLAIFLPFLKFQIFQNAIPSETLVMLPEVFLGNKVTSSLSASEVIETGNQINWGVVIYAVGAVVSLCFFLVKIRGVLKLFKFSIISKSENLQIIEVPNSYIACTFYNTIFLGNKINKKEREQILSHEMIHVYQRHTLDLLFFELLKIILWFNPLIYIYQSRISMLHEFIADAGVVEKVEKKLYFQQLLNSAFNTQNISFINQFFNQSIIKTRIVMLQKSKSKTISKFKFLIILPLLILMLAYVGCAQEHGGTHAPEDLNAEISGERTFVKETPEVVMAFSEIEEAPVFPGCEDLASNEERKTCMTQKIMEFVSANFNTHLGNELNLKGLNRVYVQFRINTDGTVEVMKVRGPHPALEEEAERVVSELPHLKPGKQDGKEVAVLYSLPISFMVKE